MTNHTNGEHAAPLRYGVIEAVTDHKYVEAWEMYLHLGEVGLLTEAEGRALSDREAPKAPSATADQ